VCETNYCPSSPTSVSAPISGIAAMSAETQVAAASGSIANARNRPRRQRDDAPVASSSSTQLPSSAAVDGKDKSSAAQGDSTRRAKTRRKKSSKSNGKADASSSSQPGAASSSGRGREGADDKVRLKVVVRKLPSNLPEEVFWKSTLPWVKTAKHVKEITDAVRAAKKEAPASEEGAQPAGSDELVQPSFIDPKAVTVTADYMHFVSGKLQKKWVPSLLSTPLFCTNT